VIAIGKKCKKINRYWTTAGTNNVIDTCLFSHDQTSDRLIWVEVRVTQLGDYLARAKVSGAFSLERFRAL